jgi:hypothetical protein
LEYSKVFPSIRKILGKFPENPSRVFPGKFSRLPKNPRFPESVLIFIWKLPGTFPRLFQQLTVVEDVPVLT